eukprot:2647143-Prorocentrum_lima.AAC.1
MTSSLVGSEMCIRDSASRIVSAKMSSPMDTAGTGGASGAGASTSATAVSYTHLTLPTICSV